MTWLGVRRGACVVLALLGLGGAVSTPGAADGGVAAAARAPSAYRVTVSPDHAQALVGDRVRLTGRVRPSAPGARVVLEMKVRSHPHRWRFVAAAQLSPRSTYRFRAPVESPHNRVYRVVKPADAEHRRGHAAAHVRVYSWHPLSEFAPEQSYPTATVAGASYPGSLTTSDAHRVVTFYVGYLCRQLDATLGVADQSPPGSTASLTLGAGELPPAPTQGYGPVGPGQAQQVVSQPFDGRYLTIDLGSAGGGTAVLGSPRLLCAVPDSR